MCTLTLGLVAASTALSTVGVFQQSAGQRRAMEYQAAVDENNATIAQWQATDAMRRGRRDESMRRLQTGQEQSRQIAALAANGVDVGSGSSLRQLVDTDLIGEIDALTIRDNAEREAYGYRTQQQQYVAQANANRMGARNINPGINALGTALGGAAQFTGVAQRYRRRGGVPGFGRNRSFSSRSGGELY